MNLPEFNLPALMGIAISFLGASAAMGKLGDYPFYMHHNDYKNITFNGTSDFSTYKPIKGLALTGDSGGTQGTISLNGVLVAEPIHALATLKDMWLMREPIRLTTNTLDTWVVITNYNEVQSSFYKDGTARVSKYSLTLKEVYGELV